MPIHETIKVQSMENKENTKPIARRVENIKATVKNFTENFYRLKLKQKEILRTFVEDFKKKKGQ